MDALAFIGHVALALGAVCAVCGILLIAAVRLWSGDDSQDRGN